MDSVEVKAGRTVRRWIDEALRSERSAIISRAFKNAWRKSSLAMCLYPRQRQGKLTGRACDPPWLLDAIIEWCSASADTLADYIDLIRQRDGGVIPTVADQDVDEKIQGKLAAAAGLPDTYRGALDEIEAWRGACAAAFGIVTGDPRGSLVALATGQEALARQHQEREAKLQAIVRKTGSYRKAVFRDSEACWECVLCGGAWLISGEEIHENDCVMEPQS